jgi:ABC-type nickel/cobalt efflux system permease component RcnA
MMTVRFLAVMFTGCALIAPGAHLFELPRKIRMSEDHYHIVQNIYLGWWVPGLLLPAAMVCNIVLVLTLTDPVAWWLGGIAAALIGINLTIFAIWTLPVNRATNNWAKRLANWEELRRQWEYSHAANAGITFLAFCAVTLAALL